MSGTSSGDRGGSKDSGGSGTGNDRMGDVSGGGADRNSSGGMTSGGADRNVRNVRDVHAGDDDARTGGMSGDGSSEPSSRDRGSSGGTSGRQ